MNNNKVKISIVCYTNTLPFRWALKKSEVLTKIDLQEDIPSICAQKLKFNQVDIALVPVALLAELPTYSIVSNYCIGAYKKVDSVMLYSDVPLHEIESIVLDYQSLTSINLVKVLSKFFWNINPTFVNAFPGFENQTKGTKASVVIGDRTFELNGNYKYEYDLAEEWFKFTQLPFVFAVWASTKNVDEKIVSEFNKALGLGVNNIDTALSEMPASSIKNGYNVSNYLKNYISYNLDDLKKQAIYLFLEYMKKL